jgi:hypothetical protein
MPAQSSDESRCFYGREFSGAAKNRRDPPREFRGHKRATARPVPCRPLPEQMTSPRGLLRSAPAALARRLGVMAGLARGRPVTFVPEQPLVAPMRHDVVDPRSRNQAALDPAGRAQRVLRQEGGACPAPARTVASACCARPLPVQRPLHLDRVPEPRRTVHGRFGRHGDSNMQNPPRPCRAGSSFMRRGDGRRPYLV